MMALIYTRLVKISHTIKTDSLNNIKTIKIYC